jgi:YggT family protein
VLLIRALISWITAMSPNFRPRGVVLVLFEAVYTVTDPPLRWLRRRIKPLRLGLVSLDLAFIVLWFLIVVLQRVIWFVFYG